MTIIFVIVKSTLQKAQVYWIWTGANFRYSKELSISTTYIVTMIDTIQNVKNWMQKVTYDMDNRGFLYKFQTFFSAIMKLNIFTWQHLEAVLLAFFLLYFWLEFKIKQQKNKMSRGIVNI